MSENSFLKRLTSRPGSAWNDHPKFAGVKLCPVVTGTETAGQFTTLLVSLAPGAQMETHSHSREVEQHLVMEGDGKMVRDGENIAYLPGSLAIIPAATEHSVTAGANGMVLIALFSPALP